MFAAAATFAQMVFDAALHTAKWLATKVFIVAAIAIVLPWALKGVLIWGFEYFVEYGREFSSLLLGYINTLSGDAVTIDVSLTGIGGYLAQQTGLIDYAAIIFSGWGIFWVIAVLAKTPGRI